MKKILITGVAGFIGFHLAIKLIKKKYDVIGVDNLNNYYDPELKKDRLRLIKNKINFHKIDISNYKSLENIFRKYKPEIVVNLAAQAGVRYSVINPKSYIKTNLIGFFNVINLSKLYNIKHFIYASSSSIYGLNKKLPFSETMKTDTVASLYGATKKSNELIAHSYAHIHNLPCTGLRFFTVYGPWGRPDMALFKFTKNILNKKEITVFNKGLMTRDFTYIDDIIHYTCKLVKKIPKRNYGLIPYQIFNLGNKNPIKLFDFIRILEKCLNKKAKIKFLNFQKTEIRDTSSDTSKLYKTLKIKKNTPTKLGIKKFVKWFKDYYKF
jgi:UDP-glucuronate 4-epimerase